MIDSCGVLKFATLLLFTIVCISAQHDERNTIFVTPHKSLCPSEQCYTINELIERGNIGSNTAIYFLSGRHVVDESISNRTVLQITNATYVELSGEYDSNLIPKGNNSVTIECRKPFALAFENITNLTISALAFVNCTATKIVTVQVTTDTDEYGNFTLKRFSILSEHTVFIEQCINISLEGVLILNGTDSGITVSMAHYFIMKRITFSRLIGKTTTSSLKLYQTDAAFLEDVKCTETGGFLHTTETPVVFQGSVTITGNLGVALTSSKSGLHFVENSVTLIANNVHHREVIDSTVYISQSIIQFWENSTVIIENNTALSCGGIKANRESRLIFNTNSTVIFSKNTGTNGGAMALMNQEASVLIFKSQDINVQFIENKARSKGGAIFVDGYIRPHRRSLIVPVPLCFNNVTPVLIFVNNSAGFAGDEIFGGWVDWPYKVMLPFPYNSNFCYNNWTMFYPTQRDDDLSVILSSNPVRVCMCTNSTPNCAIINHQIPMLYPGQTLELEAVAVGQEFGTVPSTVLAEFKDKPLTENSGRHFEQGQNIQLLGRHCTPIQYTVMSSNKQEVISLHTEGELPVPTLPADMREREMILSVKPELDILFSQFSITVHLRDCPLGFVFNTTHNKCTCHPTLGYHEITCNTTDYSVNRPQTKWINPTFINILNGTDYGILVHTHCPFDYCYDKDNSIRLEHPEDQCDFNRSGILCGACQDNFSHVFGTSRCKRCSNLWVLLVVPTIILAGVALIVFLMALDLTVSIGTINGLIFYANIVRANQPIFFPTKQTNTFLSMFIAWLNLDLGIETCFYNGLDAYTETWLQFVFPLYIWLLVTVIIVSSHYSTTASRWTPNNAVQVLATLFLLSYVKLLRLIITVFLSTVITYPNGFQRRVWLYDGNVDYLKGKHIPLFIAALLTLVVITIPYTTTVFGHQWLQRHRHCNRLLFWVRRLNPIFDAHTGPYKNNHRYWTGLLLLVRVTLLVIFTVNLSGDPSINLLAITVTILCLSMYFLFIGGPYKSKTKNLIEVFFYFNACFLSTTTLYKLKIESISATFTTTSTGISFILFMFIVFYHVLKRITETRRGARLRDSIKERVMSFVRKSTPVLELVTGQQVSNPEPVSHSSIELKEPLLVD